MKVRWKSAAPDWRQRSDLTLKPGLTRPWTILERPGVAREDAARHGEVRGARQEAPNRTKASVFCVMPFGGSNK